MKYAIYLFVGLFACLTVLPDAADAKRRGFRIPIPGGGGSEEIVKVLDLPDIPALQRPDGRYIDLGYLFHKRSGGEWIGHVGSDSQYLKLDEEGLKILLQVAGVSKLPPVPVRASSGSGGLAAIIVGILFIIGVIAIVGKVGKAIFGRASGAAARVASERALAAQEPAEGTFDPDQAIKSYLRKNPQAANAAAGQTGFGARAQSGFASASPPQFGKRGA